MNRHRSDGGMALLEALVAIALLSSALAGSAFLLVQGLQQQREAAHRAAALRQASSLAEALRALQRADGRPLQAVVTPAVPPDCPSSADDCAFERAAGLEIDRWRSATVAALPAGGTAEVGALAAPAAAYLIAVEWPEPPGGRATLRLAVEP